MQLNCGLLKGKQFRIQAWKPGRVGAGLLVSSCYSCGLPGPSVLFIFCTFFFSTENSPPQGLFSLSQWQFGPGDSYEGLLHSAGYFPLLDDNRTLQCMKFKVLSLDIARCPVWWGTQGWKQWQLLVKVCVEMLANEVESGNAPKALDSVRTHVLCAPQQMPMEWWEALPSQAWPCPSPAVSSRTLMISALLVE